MSLLVTIPALNEEKSIANVISDVKRFLPSATILVIDDGSTDKTAEIAKKQKALVLSMPFNVGVGGALRAAFKFAVENNFDQVLQIDADGQHLPSEAKRLLDVAKENSVVVGSRFLSNEHVYRVGKSRRIAMRLLASFSSLLCETRLTDVTSGFRVSSGRAVELFAREYPRDYLGDTVESLIIAHKAGIKISEVSVQMSPRLQGTPSQNSLKSIWYLFRAILVISLAIFKK